jgi:HEAT repeat protein
MTPSSPEPVAHGQPLGHWIHALKSCRPAVRQRAAQVLGDFGPTAREAIPVLLGLLGQTTSHSREWLAQALGRIGPPIPEAIPVLRAALEEADPDLPFFAAEALTLLGDDYAPIVPFLLAGLQSSTAARQGRAAQALPRFQAAVVPDLIRFARVFPDDPGGQAADPTLRRHALETLGRIGPAAQAAEGVLRQSLHDPDWHIREAAAHAVGRVGSAGAETLSALTNALDDEVREVRVAALEAVGRLGSVARSALPVVERCLVKPDVGEEEAAVEAIVRSHADEPAALACWVRRFLFEERPWRQDELAADARRRVALAILGRLHPAANALIPEMLEVLWDPRGPVRRQAALALHRLGEDSWRATVRRLRDDLAERPEGRPDPGWRPAHLDELLAREPQAEHLLDDWLYLQRTFSECRLKAADGVTGERPPGIWHDEYLRFDLGDPHARGTDARIRQVVDRATALFESAFAPGDELLLFVVRWGDHFFGSSPGYLDSLLADHVRAREIVVAGPVPLSYFPARPEAVDYRRLLAGITHLEQGRWPKVSESVYIVNRTRDLVFHMYDDRGLVIGAPDPNRLRPIEERFHPWFVHPLGASIFGGRGQVYHLQDLCQPRNALRLVQHRSIKVRRQAIFRLGEILNETSAAPEECPAGAGYRRVGELDIDLQPIDRRGGTASPAPGFTRAAVTALIHALGSRDAVVRELAAWSLGLAGAASRVAVSGLRRALADPEARVRRYAADALGQVGEGTERTLAALEAALADADAGVRAWATIPLTKLAPQGVRTAPALLRLLSDPVPRVRESAAAALGRIVPPPPGVVAGLVTALQDSERHVRHQAVEALIRLGHRAAAAAPAVIGALRHDPAPFVRQRAAFALPRLTTAAEDITGFLRSALHDTDDQVRACAAGALGQVGPAAAQAVGDLIPLLQDPAYHVRVAAAETLGAIGEAAAGAIPALREAIRQDLARMESIRDAGETIGYHLDLIRAAVHALGHIGLVALPVLVEALGWRDYDTNLYSEVAQVLARFGPTARAAVPALCHLLATDVGRASRRDIEECLDVIERGDPACET